jgi:hypothetical protein
LRILDTLADGVLVRTVAVEERQSAPGRRTLVNEVAERRGAEAAIGFEQTEERRLEPDCRIPESRSRLAKPQ